MPLLFFAQGPNSGNHFLSRCYTPLSLLVAHFIFFFIKKCIFLHCNHFCLLYHFKNRSTHYLHVFFQFFLNSLIFTLISQQDIFPYIHFSQLKGQFLGHILLTYRLYSVQQALNAVSWRVTDKYF